MIYFHRVNSEGTAEISNLQNRIHLELAESCPNLPSALVPFKKSWRNGKIVDEMGYTYLLTDDPALVKSYKAFKNKILSFHDLLKSISLIKSKALQDALHDIQTIQAHSVQEIYKLISPTIFFKEHKETIETIEKIIQSKSHYTALTLFRIRKNLADINSQITTIRINYGIPFPLQMQEHDIKKVFLHVFYRFNNDFQIKKIEWDIKGDSFMREIDYDTFSSGLVPILENMTKYTAPHTKVEIEFINESEYEQKIRFLMTSLKVESGEEEKIFLKNYTGLNARKFKLGGSGLGMYNARQLLNKNSVSIKIISGEERFSFNDVNYCNNTLELTFPS